jgi:hypothetical protein
MTSGTMAAPLPYTGATANDRLKDSFGSWFWGGLAAAVLLHFLLLAFWPEMQAEDMSIQSSQIQQVEIIQKFEIPPPPAELRRPAVPIPSIDLDIDPDLTIGSVLIEDNPVSELPSPPSGGGVDVSDQPSFTPTR